MVAMAVVSKVMIKMRDVPFIEYFRLYLKCITKHNLYLLNLKPDRYLMITLK